MSDPCVLKCRRCGHPIGERTARGWDFYNVRRVSLGGDIVLIICDHADPHRRGRCKTRTEVVLTGALRQEACA